MSSDPKSHARAAVLASSIVVSPMEEAELVRKLHVPAIRLVVRRQRPPLDLDAAIYRYRVSRDGEVSVLNEPAGARFCRATHRRSNAPAIRPSLSRGSSSRRRRAERKRSS